MNLTYSADIKYARLVCDRSGLGLNIDADNKVPHTDGSFIYLPPLNPMWSKNSKEYKNWWFSLLHESFHNIHRSDFDLIKDKKINTVSFVGKILNIIIDFKIETCNRGEFVGRDKLVHKARYLFARDEIYRHLGTGDPKDALRPILEAVWVLDAIARIPWIPEYKTDNLSGLLSPQGVQHLNTLLSSNTLLHNYQSQKTSEDSYNVWLEVLTLLEIDKDDPEYASAPEPQDTTATDGSGMGWVKFSALATHDHSESNRESGLHIEFDTVSEDTGWIPLPIQEVDLDQEFLGPRDTKLRHELGGLFNQVHLSKKIRRELQSVSRTRTVTNKRRGKLHKRALYKTAADAMAKVFKQRDVRFTPKTTSVMLLQDWSGSMGCNKFKNASVATHEVGRVLQSLKIPFAIYGFSTRCTENLLFKMKSFSETFSTEKYKHRCVNASHNMHSNADGDFILWGAEQLMRKKCNRRILFVLSDGSPAAYDKYGNTDIMAFTQNTVKKIEDTGHIEIYAIGIEDRNVDLIYKNRCTIDRSDELEGKLLSVLRNKILMGIAS